MHHVQNAHMVLFDAIDDNVLADRKGTNATAKFGTEFSGMGVLGQDKKSLGNKVNQAICDFKTAALFGDVLPNLVQFCFRLARQASSPSGAQFSFVR